MKRRSVIFIIVIISFSFVFSICENLVYSQDTIVKPKIVLNSAEDCMQVSDRFMEIISSENYEEAFSFIKLYWPLPENELLMLQKQTMTQINIIAPRYGDITGYEFVSKEEIGSFALRLIYVQKRERHFIRWKFIFYKPLDRWIVNSLSYDDKLFDK
jgi:hypothetical protein